MFNEINCKKSSISNRVYGRRHSNYLPTVMFRGTPCILNVGTYIEPNKYHVVKIEHYK